MTSTASLAFKNEKQLALYILSDFPGIRDLNDLNSLNNLSGLNDLCYLFSSKKLYFKVKVNHAMTNLIRN